MRCIRFSIYTGEKDESGRTVKSVIRNIESNFEGKTMNELPYVLHALAGTSGLVKENDGFPYTLPFELS